jgi:hypothetical protein
VLDWFLLDGPARKELEYIVRYWYEHAVVFGGEVSYEELTSKNYYSMGDVLFRHRLGILGFICQRHGFEICIVAFNFGYRGNR